MGNQEEYGRYIGPQGAIGKLWPGGLGRIRTLLPGERAVAASLTKEVMVDDRLVTMQVCI